MPGNLRCFAEWRRVMLLLCLLATAQLASSDADDMSVSARLHRQITRPDPVLLALTYDWTYLERFYILRDYKPAWFEASGPTLRASTLRQYLHVADEDGLSKQGFHLSAIESGWHRRSPDELATLDILLSDALLRYAMQMRRGHITPELVDPEWHIAMPDLHPVTMLQNLLASSDFESALQGLAPKAAGYRGLRAALARYRRLAVHGGWPQLNVKTALREGMRNPQVTVLRRRLFAEGDLQDIRASDSEYFDALVKFAVERFQVRHGLRMDGVVGAMTRAAMNVPVTDRIRQIVLNMERWRWLPRKLGARYIIVNSAGYELTAFEQTRPRFTMWVVIGKQDRQTPELDGVLHSVVFNPYWTVPISIAVEDLIPAQERDPGYLQTRKIRVFTNLAKQIELNPRSVDWTRYTQDHFPFVLRQDPGPYNALGRFKFLFSNKFDIYLHDTPARQLFGRKQRTFSSGCIRVENPRTLAKFLLEKNPGWGLDRIRTAVDSAQTHEVKLAREMPIYLVYLTAWAGPDATMYFYPDVYARDPALAACLFSARDSREDGELRCLL